MKPELLQAEQSRMRDRNGRAAPPQEPANGTGDVTFTATELVAALWNQCAQTVRQPADHAGKPRLLRLKDAARYLSISTKTLRDLVHDQQLRVVTLGEHGGPWLIDVKDLDALIETRKLLV